MTDLSPLPDTSADQQFGWVHEVNNPQIGSALVQAAVEDDEELHVVDAAMFDPDGGSLVMNGGVMGYVSADPEDDVIVLAGPLAAAYAADEGDTVAVWSEGRTAAERLAMVEFANGDGDDDPIPAILSSGASGKLRNGDRGGRGEVVLLDMHQGQWRIVDVLGTDTAPLGEDELDPNAPAAPEGVVVTSSAYLVAGGRYQAMIHVEWDPVETYTNGTPIDWESPIRRYDIGHGESGGPYFVIASTGATATAYDQRGLPAGDEASYAVRAISAGGVAGPWSAGFDITLASDDTPPQTPSTPILSTRLGTIRATWDGRAAGGGAMDADLAYAEIHASATPTFTPTVGDLNTIVVRLTGAGYGIVVNAPYNTNRTFKIIAVDTSGNVSLPSEAATIATTPLVDTDLIGEIISGANIVDGSITASEKIIGGTITGALIQGLTIEAGHLKANAVTADKIEAGAIDTVHLAAGAITADKIDVDALTGKVIVGGTLSTAASGPRTHIGTWYGGDAAAVYFIASDGQESCRLRPRGDYLNAGLFTVSLQLGQELEVGTTVHANGRITSGVDLQMLNPNPTSSGANVFIASNGVMARSSSSAARFKENRRDPGLDLDAMIDAVDLALFDYREEVGGFKDIIGVFADDAVGTPLENFVDYEDGEVSNFNYARAGFVLAHSIGRGLRARTLDLEVTVEALTARLAALEVSGS